MDSKAVSEPKFFITQRARFVLQQHWNTVAYRIGKACTARAQFLPLPVIFQGSLGNGAHQQLEQSGFHAPIITRLRAFPGCEALIERAPEGHVDIELQRHGQRFGLQ